MKKYIYAVLAIIALIVSIAVLKSAYSLAIFGLSIGGGLMWWCLSIAALFAILAIAMVISVIYLLSTIFKRKNR